MPLRPIINTQAAGAEILFKRYIALPSEHGAWVFMFSPLLIGLFAARRFQLASILVIIAALAAFLLRQPVTMVVKVFSGRRGKAELPAAYFWSGIYGLIGLVAVGGLTLGGYAYLLVLTIPGLLVFAWHLYLVSRRAERRQAGVEIVASGALALAAPAAYWVGVGSPDPTGWWLFALCWLQSAASIVHAYLRLAQREWKNTPDLRGRLHQGRRALLYTTFNMLVVTGLAGNSILPVLLPIPYALQWFESIYGALRPALGVKPTRIGLRQLLVSTLFTILFILTWNLNPA